MKILILDEEFPFPLNSGGRIRGFNLASRLARTNEVSYFAYGKNDSPGYRAFKEAGLRPIAVDHSLRRKSGPVFYIKLLANLFSDLPYVVTSHYSHDFAVRLKQEIKANKPDLLYCAWSPYASFFQEIGSVKKVIGTHNIEATIWKRYYENESNPLKKWYIGGQYRKMLRFEKSVFGRADGVTAVSCEEADQIRQMGDTRVELVDNGVDPEFFAPGEITEKSNRLVFTGSMDWRPNQDAVFYFAHEIMPALRDTRPDLKAVFVGRNPPPHVKALAETPGIEITGTVDDVRSYISEAAVYIVPLRIGGGSRLKILEALAMKKAVVSTAVGAEGLEVTDNEQLLVARDTEEFVQKTVRLLDDHDLRERLGSNGRALVERRYGWDSLAEKLNGFLKSVAESQ